MISAALPSNTCPGWTGAPTSAMGLGNRSEWTTGNIDGGAESANAQPVVRGRPRMLAEFDWSAYPAG